jgi:DNA-binding MarR family transcriptional regulator
MSPADAETRLTGDDHEALRLWLRLYATSNLVEQRVRRRLQERFDTTLPRFDLMAQLERAPEGLKMGDLSRRMMVTGGNVTGVVDALEKDGLVARIADPSDRRAWRVRLTAVGRRAFRGMAAEHERWIADAFSGLAASDIAQLSDLLGRLKQQIRATEESA